MAQILQFGPGVGQCRIEADQGTLGMKCNAKMKPNKFQNRKVNVTSFEMSWVSFLINNK